jgi:hypothetical protein
MTDFRTWFTERAIYLFPDGTPVVAQFFDAGDNPCWWFVEARADGRPGLLLAAVLPNGSVWDYVPWPDRSKPEICRPQRSDLTIADLRPAARPHAVGDSLARAGRLLVALWCTFSLESWWDLSSSVAACLPC